MPETPEDRSQWNKRPDGTTKGSGFLGVLSRPDGRVSSELSMGTTDVTGKELDIPTLVPTLTKDEVKSLLASDGDKIPDSIAAKAISHARQRLAQKRPVFADEGEQQYHIYPDLKRVDVPTAGFNDAVIKPMAGHESGGYDWRKAKR